MLDDLALFVAVITQGNYSRAAEVEAVPPATLSRRIKALEADMGCQLLHRSAHHLTPTEAGQRLYDACHPLIRELRQVTASLGEELHGLRGTVTVLAPINLANDFLPNAWVRFLERYPEVRLDLRLSNRFQDHHLATPFDLALRAGPQPDSSLISQKIASVPSVLVATEEYLNRNGWPEHPEDLHAHRLLVAAPIDRWEFRPRSASNGPPVTIHARGPLRVDEIQLATRTAEAGLGILMLPLPLVRDTLSQGRLVRVLPEWLPQNRDIYLVRPSRDFVPARVRALMEILIEEAIQQSKE